MYISFPHLIINEPSNICFFSSSVVLSSASITSSINNSRTTFDHCARELNREERMKWKKKKKKRKGKSLIYRWTRHKITKKKKKKKWTKATKVSPREASDLIKARLIIDVAGRVHFLTCFADPIQVTVQFMLELLLSSQFEEGLPVLHLFSLLRKLSTSVT